MFVFLQATYNMSTNVCVCVREGESFMCVCVCVCVCVYTGAQKHFFSNEATHLRMQIACNIIFSSFFFDVQGNTGACSSS